MGRGHGEEDDESLGLSSAAAAEYHARHGYNEVTAASTPEWKKILYRYLDWVSIVILITAILSIAIPVEVRVDESEPGGEPPEKVRGWVSFGLLLLELNLIVWVGYYSDRNELSAPLATTKRDSKWLLLPVRDLCVGDVLLLKGGDVIPADAVLIGRGEPLKVDESSLTGESLPVTKRVGDNLLSGAVVMQGELEARVTAIGVESFFGKTITLIQAGEDVLDAVSKALGVIGATFILIIVIVLLTRDEEPGNAIVTGFIIFVSVVPIGMPVVTTTVLAVGARELANEKAIVSRLSAMEELSGMEILCSDKTGTLTKNELELDVNEVLAWGEYTNTDVLKYAALSARWENNDAIDKAIVSSVDNDQSVLDGFVTTRFIPFNPVDKKTAAYVITPSGLNKVYSKGAPHVIGEMVNDPKQKEAVEKYMDERASRGLRSLGVMESGDEGKSWSLVGCISLLDPPRDDSAATIRLAQELGIEVKMVTGDQRAIAIETCRRLGMGTSILPSSHLTDNATDDNTLAQAVDDADGFAGVYPEHKHRIVEVLQSRGRLIGMTGDGVNDAPALKRANVGIAVAGATEAAKGAADIILTQPGISTIITAIIRSRKIFARLQTYIIYRMASSLLILFFFFFAIIVLDFQFPTWTLVLISIQNDLAVMTTSFDKVHSSPFPELWNMTKCLIVAGAVAACGLVGSLLLVVVADPARSIDWWSGWKVELGAGETPLRREAQLVAVTYLQLSIAIQLAIFATRTPSFFWRFTAQSGKGGAPRPSVALILPDLILLMGATFLAVYWPIGASKAVGGGTPMQGAGWAACGITWLWGVCWFIIADAVKVPVWALFTRYTAEARRRKDSGLPRAKWMRRWGRSEPHISKLLRPSSVLVAAESSHDPVQRAMVTERQTLARRASQGNVLKPGEIY
eukprot:jgi/Chlat1/2463/Chrsp171S02344